MPFPTETEKRGFITWHWIQSQRLLVVFSRLFKCRILGRELFPLSRAKRKEAFSQRTVQNDLWSEVGLVLSWGRSEVGSLKFCLAIFLSRSSISLPPTIINIHRYFSENHRHGDGKLLIHLRYHWWYFLITAAPDRVEGTVSAPRGVQLYLGKAVSFLDALEASLTSHFTINNQLRAIFTLNTPTSITCYHGSKEVFTAVLTSHFGDCSREAVWSNRERKEEGRQH